MMQIQRPGEVPPPSRQPEVQPEPVRPLEPPDPGGPDLVPQPLRPEQPDVLPPGPVEIPTGGI